MEDNGEREAWSGSCRQQFNVFCADRNKDRLDVMEAKLSGKNRGKELSARRRVFPDGVYNASRGLDHATSHISCVMSTLPSLQSSTIFISFIRMLFTPLFA